MASARRYTAVGSPLVAWLVSKGCDVVLSRGLSSPIGDRVRELLHRQVLSPVMKTLLFAADYQRLLAAEIAVEVLTRALAEDDLTATLPAEYDRRRRSLLGREIEVGVRFRQLARGLDDTTLAFLIDLANRDGIRRAIQSHLLLDWDAPLLSALLDGSLSLLRTL